MKKRILFLIALLMGMLLIFQGMVFAEGQSAEMVDIQILATSDLHGMFYPWDYMLDRENTKGSLAQVATAVQRLRTENTLVLDVGDAIQDNAADIFVNDDVNAMIAGLNMIGYDACTTGNHEYNYGIDTLKHILSQHQAQVLVGNVWDQNGEPLGKPYAIFEKSGIRIGVIGMVTPNILRWDAANLKGCTVTNPVEETRKLIDEIQDQTDILIGIMHMGVENEYGVKNSGVRDLIAACPEFDVVIAAHDHQAIEGTEIDGVLVVENKNQAQTMSEIHLLVEKSEDGCKLTGRSAKLIAIEDYEADPAMLEFLLPFHTRALTYSHTVIGELKGGDLAPANEIREIPQAQLQDTALIDLINNTMLYYSGAKVSATALMDVRAGLSAGDIRLCDVSLIYKYTNTLYTLSMTGAQLKTYMEWSASYYQQYQDGDLTIAFNPGMRSYMYDMFEGVRYEIDVSRPVGERIQNLTWMDGTPLQDTEEFLVAVNNYRANSVLLSPGKIFEEGNLPKLVEIDVHASDIGGIREQIAAFISDVYGGVLTPDVNHNWKIIGNSWNSELHQKAVEQLNDGTLSLAFSEDGRSINSKAITTADLK